MTVKEMIEYTDKLKPNSFDFEIKLSWINQVEGMLQSEILKMPLDKIKVLSNENDTLSIMHPYSQAYNFYIASMIDFFSGDFAKYENSSAAYNDVMKRYAKYLLRGVK